MSSDKKPRKRFIADMTDDDLYSDAPPVQVDEAAADGSAKVDVDGKVDAKVDAATPRKTFHSKRFVDDVDDNSSADAPEVKRKISHAEASGILISVVMVGYSLVTEDKPLFFISTALLIFLLRPIIGGLFGKHNRAVQNALHGFSIALFVGALMFLFL